MAFASSAKVALAAPAPPANSSTAPGQRWVLLGPDLVDPSAVPSPMSREECKTVPEMPLCPSPTLSTLSLHGKRVESLGRLGGTFNGRSGGWANYTVRLVGEVALASTAGGVIAASYLCDPSSLPLSEWSTFAALFDEVRCKGFSVAFAPSLTPNQLVAASAVGSFTRTTSTPSSYAAVLVAPDSVLMPPSNTTQMAYRHVMKYPRDILFASTATPAPGAYAGCPGSIQIYSNGQQVSVSVITVFIAGTYSLRGRL